MFWNSLTRTVAPTSLPVTLADIKSHLAISHSDEDAYLTSLINVATAYVDGPNGAGIALRPQTWRASYDSVPLRHAIPFGPVRSIVSIVTGTTTVSPTTYNLDTDMGILFLDNAIYPSDVRTKITFTVGYDSIPDDLQHVIRLLVGHLYANREATALVAMHDVPLAVESVLNRYRVHVV